MSKIASMGHGYNGPSYHDIRVNLLKDAKQSVHLIVESYKKNWSETGCTIMSDGWRNTRHRPLINFLVYCSKGISFIKSVDASDIESNTQKLCNLFSEIVEIVGLKNVVHMVTDNAVGKLFCEKYPSVCWSPYAAHCINLIMKDIEELSHVDSLITLASRVTVFIYNHKWSLNWLIKRPGGTEIIHPGATHFEVFSGVLEMVEKKVVEEEGEGEIDLDELDNMVEEEPQNNDPSTSKMQGNVNNDDADDDDDIVILEDLDLCSYQNA
ncbi:L-type lectin-domain containing receptor kinase S.4-like [Hibiscus syriacus]|uniref:L-type lectin-domain containing receptor kinase S.4-like n=1 Tax=Hibiscus syriacus TaxID=106335 RepID=A0A6A3BVS8_HIBSY|nr:L-type lectin-domain containing receptor kinase S.4-like [Hibiscus syriacus]